MDNLTNQIENEFRKTEVPDMDKWLEKASKLEIFYDSVVPEPETVLEVATLEGNTSIIGTLGNFSVISGEMKSGKGFLISCCLASAIGNMETLGCLQGNLPTGKKNVMLFDTEQGLHHVKKSIHRIAAMTGKHATNIRVFSFRGETPEDAINMIQSMIYSDPNLGFVGIDGIADLMHDSNDIKEANAINNYLLKWTKDLHIHIMTVVHTNPGKDKARGHLGTELQRKGEGRLIIEKEKGANYFTVKQAESREREFKTPIAFYIDDEGVPQGTEFIGGIGGGIPVKKADISPDQLRTIISDCYESGEGYKRTDLAKRIQEQYLNHTGISLGVVKSKEFVTKAASNGYVFQKTAQGAYFIKVV